MTALATMAGMIPLSLAIGAGSQMLQPLAIAVIGGLVTSTALTLVMVPAAFTWIDDFEQWLKRKLSFRAGSAADAGAPVPAEAPAANG